MKQHSRNTIPQTVVIGVASPIKKRDEFSRRENIMASGILIKKAEPIPCTITGTERPEPLKNPIKEKSMQVRMHSEEKPFRNSAL